MIVKTNLRLGLLFYNLSRLDLNMSISEEKTIRFCIGDKENAQSSVWRLWANGSEVYLGSRSLIAFIKFSFHKSGVWRLAQHDKQPRKAMYSWKRPSPNKTGITQCISIAIPPILVAEPFETKLKEGVKVRWFPPLTNNEKRIFKILFAEVTINESLIFKFLPPNSEIIWSYELLNKEKVILATWIMNLPEEEETSIKDSINKLKIHVKPGANKNLFSNIFLYDMKLPSQGAEGQPTVFDLALGEENFETP